MGYPANPDTIILKNRYYPKGVKEIDIWNYYQSVKPKLLESVRNRDIMLIVMTDHDKPVIRRRGQGANYIRITPANYDQIITGRTVSIHASMGTTENMGIIDVDVHPDDGLDWAKEATIRTYDYIMERMAFIRSVSIIFTGKGSFHLRCKFSQKMKIDTIRFLLEKFLRESPLSKVYTINKKRVRGVPNLDLAPNKFRGNFIAEHALSVIGLRCMEVPYNRIRSFDPMSARIKIQ